MSPNLIIYLRSSPVVALSRVHARNRQEERNISLQYLEDINYAHEQWLNASRESYESSRTTDVLGNCIPDSSIKSNTEIVPLLKLFPDNVRIVVVNADQNLNEVLKDVGQIFDSI